MILLFTWVMMAEIMMRTLKGNSLFRGRKKEVVRLGLQGLKYQSSRVFMAI